MWICKSQLVIHTTYHWIYKLCNTYNVKKYTMINAIADGCRMYSYCFETLGYIFQAKTVFSRKINRKDAKSFEFPSSKKIAYIMITCIASLISTLYAQCGIENDAKHFFCKSLHISVEFFIFKFL